jgi:hypothetical protein
MSLNDTYALADAAYRRGWEDRHRGKDYDPRGTAEWQAVADAMGQTPGLAEEQLHAARYRWLRDHARWAMRRYPMLQWHLPYSFHDERSAGERLDASIDAARRHDASR